MNVRTLFLPQAKRASYLLVLAVLAAAGVLLAARGTKPHPTTYSKPTIDVALAVSDLDRSLAFYQNALGMRRIGAFDVPGDGAQAAGLTDGRPFHVEVLALGEEPEATRWKLVRVDGAPHNRSEYIHDGIGLRYVTLHVHALAPLLARLAEHRIRPPAHHPIDLGNGQHFALIRDPDGVFIELVGPLHAPE